MNKEPIIYIEILARIEELRTLLFDPQTDIGVLEKTLKGTTRAISWFFGEPQAAELNSVLRNIQQHGRVNVYTASRYAEFTASHLKVIWKRNGRSLT